MHRFQSKTELLEHKTTVRLAALKNVGQEMLAVDTISRSWMFVVYLQPTLASSSNSTIAAVAQVIAVTSNGPKLRWGSFFTATLDWNHLRHRFESLAPVLQACAKNSSKYPTTEVNPTKVKPSSDVSRCFLAGSVFLVISKMDFCASSGSLFGVFQDRKTNNHQPRIPTS